MQVGLILYILEVFRASTTLAKTCNKYASRNMQVEIVNIAKGAIFRASTTLAPNSNGEIVEYYRFITKYASRINTIYTRGN